MVDENTIVDSTAEDAVVSRIYEVGYHIIASVGEDKVEKVVGDIRAVIEKSSGSFIAEGAPVLTRLAYPMQSREGDRWIEEDRGYFGWIKFEAAVGAAQILTESLKQNRNILRHIVFQTVREETRARLKTPTLREVRRTDTLKPTVRREEESAPVSEVELDKALSEITTE